MFKQLRLDLDLTQSDLALLTGRSRNYVVKAEQCTFPTPPVPLVEFYRTGGILERKLDRWKVSQFSTGNHGALLTLNGELPLNLGGTSPPPVGLLKVTEWQGIPKEILEAAYYSEQQAIRVTWLRDWEPNILSAYGLPFNLQWVSKIATAIVHPTEYRLSTGLCVPAAAVFKAVKDGVYAKSLKAALDDLIEYVDSGLYVGSSNSSLDRSELELLDNLQIIRKSMK
jgi:hypothetical protein